MEYKGTSEFSDLMKYAPMNIVISASLFFWNLGNDLVQTSLTYLEREMKGKGGESLSEGEAGEKSKLLQNFPDGRPEALFAQGGGPVLQGYRLARRGDEGRLRPAISPRFR